MRRLWATAATVVLLGARLYGQAPAPSAAGAQPPQTPRAMAPFDLTGYWVSVVTEDWRWRMVVPKKGDYASVPLSTEGRKVADRWDPARMAEDGCKPYGAAAIMRVPGRLRIAWEDAHTLRIDTDAGQQTRRLHFARTPPPAARTWQGHSTAEWEQIRSLGGLGVSLQTPPPRTGALKVVTTGMRAGYLRRNGVPYSEQAVMTEYFDRFTDEGTDWLTVLTIVEDPLYLSQPFITSTHFKREPDGSKWMPAPCGG
ncbi:MAG TPA: hypothetical protein VNI78_10135 [Vicinamibacterales bacterium]|nr:hypothetical protein [Vicinamibacterales bacterium]